MTQMLAANASWFNFTAQSGDFGVYAFSGFEEVCKPYEFSIELVSRSANVDLTALLAACIGPQTGAVAQALGMEVHTAKCATIDSLIQLVKQMHKGE